MQPLCSNCLFWNKIGEMPGRPGQWGLCRRYAPQAQVTPKETFQYTAWPPTAENEWCGEYQKENLPQLEPNKLYEK
jgi:hypothetical protein